jgi:hypothetical protein
MQKILTFHNTPALTREYVNNWLKHAKKDSTVSQAQIAVLEDVLKLIDVAMEFLDPGPAEPAES